MLFNTIDFVIFLIAVVIVYYAIPANKYRKLFLLAASYYFYACWNVAFLGLLVFDTLVAYVAGWMMECKEKIFSEKKIMAINCACISSSFLLQIPKLFLNGNS